MKDFGFIAAAIAAGSLASAASAGVVGFNVYENADGVGTSGLLLTVELTDVGGTSVDFELRNDGSLDSVVTSIYFENTAFLIANLTNPRIQAESAGVDYSDGATPPNPASIPASFGGAWAGNAYATDPDPPPSSNGINNNVGESLTIRFDYVGGATLADIQDALTSDPTGFRIAQHVQSIGPSSVWTVTPAPGTAALAGLGMMIFTRRRRA